MNKGFTLVECLVVSIIVAILFLILWPAGFMPDYSDGQRTGDVYKFSQKGIFWKSYEGEMYLGGVSSSQNGLEVDKFYFSIPAKEAGEKAELIKRLNECSQKRLKCTVSYREWFRSPVSQGSSYTVVGVELPN